jgi:PKD repeat protein
MNMHRCWIPALGLAVALGVAPGCGKKQPKQVTAESTGAAAAKPAAKKGGKSAKGRTNRPPKARFEVNPLTGLSQLTGVDFDASFSSDDYNLSSELQHRWDFDGDGKWDTGFTVSERTTYVYPSPGRFRPRLLVVDAAGLADSTVGTEIVIQPPCPAPDFALRDVNPNSHGYGKVVRLSELKGKPVLAWFVAPTK